LELARDRGGGVRAGRAEDLLARRAAQADLLGEHAAAAIGAATAGQRHAQHAGVGAGVVGLIRHVARHAERAVAEGQTALGVGETATAAPYAEVHRRLGQVGARLARREVVAAGVGARVAIAAAVGTVA